MFNKLDIMTKEDVEKAKTTVSETVSKINAIDLKIAEFQEQYKKLLEMRRKGILYCAQTLKPLDDKNRAECLEGTDEKLVDEINANMFMFNDLAKLDKRDLQKILFKCNTDDLAYAVKLLENTPVKKAIYSNVSKNNLQQLREKENSLGEPDTVDKHEVMAAQRKIIDLTLEMEKSGEIVFPDGI